MVRPFPFDLVCSCGEFIFTPHRPNAEAFITKHVRPGHRASQRQRTPASDLVRRFVIRRHKLTTMTDRPWVLRDRSRPAYLGHFATLDLALAGIKRKLDQERGYMPTIDEIKAAMSA